MKLLNSLKYQKKKKMSWIKVDIAKHRHPARVWISWIPKALPNFYNDSVNAMGDARRPSLCTNGMSSHIWRRRSATTVAPCCTASPTRASNVQVRTRAVAMLVVVVAKKLEVLGCWDTNTTCTKLFIFIYQFNCLGKFSLYSLPTNVHKLAGVVPE